MWIVPSEFSKALDGLARLGGADDQKSFLDVPASGNGNGRTADGIDTSTWFESQLPPAAEQPEAKIELSSIQPGISTAPSLADVTEQARIEAAESTLPPAPPKA
jgi:hypothetical protein